MNTELLSRVREAVLLNPSHVSMLVWDDGEQADIAGWAVRLAGEALDDREKAFVTDTPVEAAAGALLHISPYQDRLLFYPTEWPWEYASRLANHPPGSQPYAEIVAARIDHFIETGR